MVLPGRQGDGRAVGQHHDEPVVYAGQRLEQGELVGRQVHVGPVEALGLRRAGQAEADQDVVGIPGRGHRLLHQRVVRRGAVQGEAGREAYVHLAAQPGGQLAEQHVDPGRVDLRAARALEPRRTGELPDDRDGGPGGWGQRQHAVGVLEQHRRLQRRPVGQPVVLVDVELAALRAGRPGLPDQPEQAAYGGVEHRLLQPSLGDRSHHGIPAERVVGRGAAHAARPVCHATGEPAVRRRVAQVM